MLEVITLKSRTREVRPPASMQVIFEVRAYGVTHRNQILEYKNCNGKNKKKSSQMIQLSTKNTK